MFTKLLILLGLRSKCCASKWLEPSGYDYDVCSKCFRKVYLK